MSNDAFVEALDDLLGELFAPEPVTKARARSEVGELFEANNQPPPPGEPRYYSRSVRSALRARTLSDEEGSRILSLLESHFLVTQDEEARAEWGGRAWFLEAMRAAPPPAATETLMSLMIPNWDTFTPSEKMVASLALYVHLVAWRHSAKRPELAAALDRSDARGWLGTVTEGGNQRNTMSSVRGMVASLLSPDGERVPAGARFRVQLGSDDGFREIVHVWARDEEEATEQATEWIAGIERDAVYQGPIRSERIGDDPDPTDLGIADRNDEVYYRRYDADGRPRSTLLHVEIGDVERLTTAFRSDRSLARVRDALASEGIDPMKSAAIAITPHPDPGNDPFLVMVVTADGSVRVWRGGPGWDEEDLVTLEEHWRRWRRAGKRYLEPEDAGGERN